jgi:hypothetical protein
MGDKTVISFFITIPLLFQSTAILKPLVLFASTPNLGIGIGIDLTRLSIRLTIKFRRKILSSMMILDDVTTTLYALHGRLILICKMLI